MKKITKFQIFRLIIQFMFLIFLPGLYVIVFNNIVTSFQAITAGNATFFGLAQTIIIILSTIVIGRFFCGWVCAFGTYNDIVYTLFNKIFRVTRIKVSKNMDKGLKLLKYIILIFLLIFVSTKILNVDKISPWGAFANITDPTNLFSTYLIGFLILIVITIFGIFIERFFCRYLCPLGAIFKIFPKMRVFKIEKLTNNCGSCKACSNECSMGIDLSTSDTIKNGECIQCFKCIEICPRKNCKATVAINVVDKTAVAAIAVGTLTGALIINNNIQNSKTKILADNIATTIDVQNNVPSTSDTSIVTPAPVVKKTKYNDGEYTASAVGYRPGLNVIVIIKNDKITKISIGKNNETPDFASIPFVKIPAAIINSQSTSVDTISGATYTSRGIINAVDDALKKATVIN